jgi:hypothetical protein
LSLVIRLRHIHNLDEQLQRKADCARLLGIDRYARLRTHGINLQAGWRNNEVGNISVVEVIPVHFKLTRCPPQIVSKHRKFNLHFSALPHELGEHTITSA